MPVPMEAKRTVSLGATGRAVAESMRGCRTFFVTVVAAMAPVPMWMN
jgi:hypothetical protein